METTLRSGVSALIYISMESCVRDIANRLCTSCTFSTLSSYHHFDRGCCLFPQFQTLTCLFCMFLGTNLSVFEIFQRFPSCMVMKSSLDKEHVHLHHRAFMTCYVAIMRFFFFTIQMIVSFL